MLYAHVENGIVTYRGSLPKNWRNISGLNISAGNADLLEPLGWLPYVETADPIGVDDTPAGEVTTITPTQVLSHRASRAMTAGEIISRDNATVEQEIARLEALETPLRLADAILDPTDGKTWLINNRAAIDVERGKLR